MAAEDRVKQEIYPKDPNKTYGLMELMKGRAPLVDKGGPEDAVFAWPHLMIWLTLIFLGMTVFLIIMGWAFDAPLREPFDADVPENPAKAPWYFLNLQELLLHMDKSLAGVIVPTVAIVGLIVLPYLDRSPRDVGRWFGGTRKGIEIAVFSAVFTIVTEVALIVFDEVNIYGGFTRAFGESLSGLMAVIVIQWTIPVIIMVALTGMLIGMIYVRWKPTAREMSIGIFTGFAVTYLLLIVASTFFRGFGMHLTWPWDLPPGAIPF